MPDDWHSVREDIVLDHPEYQLSLEEYRRGEDQMVFIHLYVWKDWSAKLLKRFMHEWKILRKHVTCPLYACADIDDDKWSKFVQLFGFKPLSEAICTDGKTRRIYWHQGNGQVTTANTINSD